MLIGRSHGSRPPVTVDAAPIAVDLGSSLLRIWLGPGRTLSVPLGHGLRSPVVRRGRIIDGPACVSELRRILRDHRTRSRSARWSWPAVRCSPRRPSRRRPAGCSPPCSRRPGCCSSTASGRAPSAPAPPPAPCWSPTSAPSSPRWRC
ncbi:hypothetical protein V2I01_42430 [Micromonospora sp. BRA006-A]|nr:hypothetical protein [Micromonospora sp. BRA006-A]